MRPAAFTRGAITNATWNPSIAVFSRPADSSSVRKSDRVRPLRQPLQAELGDDAVLADERHDVSDRADRGKLQECRQPFLAVEPLAQRLDDLERDADAGQVLVRVRCSRGASG